MNSTSQSYQNLLIETQIFPCITTMALYAKAQKVLLEAHENYQKRSYRNRYCIGSHQGPLWLTVPLVKGKNNQQVITDVKISYDSPWASSHWKAIQTSYSKSAFFIHYKDSVRDILFSKPSHLFQLNLMAMNTLLDLLELDVQVGTTEHYNPLITDTHTFDARSMIHKSIFEKIHMEKYYQVYSASTGFIPHLSILDLLFHLGPESYSYLSNLSIEQGKL